MNNTRIEEALKLISEKSGNINYDPKVKFDDIPIEIPIKYSAEITEKTQSEFLSDNIADMKNTWYLDYHQEKYFEGAKSRIKRVVHKMCNFYMEPLTAGASEFNSSVTVSIDKLYNELLRQKEIIELQNEKIADLEERLKNLQG